MPNQRQREKVYNHVENKETILNTFQDNSIINLGPYCRGCGLNVTKDKYSIKPTQSQIDNIYKLASEKNLNNKTITNMLKNYTKDRQGIIDCIDNSGDHAKLENLQLLCRVCNTIKNIKKTTISTTLQMSYSQKKNLKIEPLFRAYVVNRVIESGGMYSVEDAINGGAEKYGFSKKTAGDYLDKLTSIEGPLKDHNGSISWDDSKSIKNWFNSEDNKQSIQNLT